MEKCWDNVINPAMENIDEYSSLVEPYFTEEKGIRHKSLLDCHNEKSREMIHKVIDWFSESKDNNLVYTSYNQKENKDVYMVALRNDDGELIAYYEKHEYRDKESMKMYDFN